MPPPTPHREMILRRLVGQPPYPPDPIDASAVFPQISVANGFFSDVKISSREFRAPNEFDPSELPAMMAFAGAEVEAQAETNGIIASVFTVIVWGIVYDPEHSSERLEELVADHKVAIRTYTDAGFSGGAREGRVHLGTHPETGAYLIENAEMQTIETLEGLAQPWEGFRAEWETTFRYTAATP